MSEATDENDLDLAIAVFREGIHIDKKEEVCSGQAASEPNSKQTFQPGESYSSRVSNPLLRQFVALLRQFVPRERVRGVEHRGAGGQGVRNI